MVLGSIVGVSLNYFPKQSKAVQVLLSLIYRSLDTLNYLSFFPHLNFLMQKYPLFNGYAGPIIYAIGHAFTT